MPEVRDQTLSGDLQVEGQNYINCQFSGARLIYRGGTPPGFANCAFDDSNFVFEGAAGQTLNFLRIMAPKATNMREVVLGLIPELRD